MYRHTTMNINPAAAMPVVTPEFRNSVGRYSRDHSGTNSAPLSSSPVYTASPASSGMPITPTTRRGMSRTRKYHCAA